MLVFVSSGVFFYHPLPGLLAISTVFFYHTCGRAEMGADGKISLATFFFFFGGGGTKGSLPPGVPPYLKILGAWDDSPLAPGFFWKNNQKKIKEASFI